MHEVEEMIYGYEGAQRALLLTLHRFLTERFGLIAKPRYKLPFYFGKSWVCYLNPSKQGHVELAFLRGNELANEQLLLEARGRKQVKGIVLTNLDTIPFQPLSELIQEAILLDKAVPYALKRRSS
jgi:hypothetical protein